MQNAKDLEHELTDTVTNVDRAAYTETVYQIVDAKSLPSMPQLTGLWLSMMEQIQASSEISKSTVSLVNSEGVTEKAEAYRLGSIGLVAESGYVWWDARHQDAIVYLKQPSQGPTLASLSTLANGEVSNVVVDPSRGFMLEQLALEPSLADRLQAGGLVGKVILSCRLRYLASQALVLEQLEASALINLSLGEFVHPLPLLKVAVLMLLLFDFSLCCKPQEHDPEGCLPLVQVF